MPSHKLAAERRRRWLVEGSLVPRDLASTDPTPIEPEPAGRAAPAGEKASSHRLASRMDAQPRVTDLIPKTYAAFALWFLAGLTIIAGLEALYAYMPEIARRTTDGRVAAFDLDGEGSLAVWFSSATLAAAALATWIVFSVRRQKADDYDGRYRVWAWAGACWLAMSIDECASVHEGFKELMASVAGSRLYGDGSVWWVGGYMLVLSWIGLRLVSDMRACKGSMTFLFATGGLYAAAVLAQLNIAWPDGGARAVMLEEGCEMAGNLCLLLSMGLHARFCILEAQGLLPEKAVREKPVKTKAPPVEKPVVKKEAKPAAATAEPEKRSGWFSWGGKRAAVDPPHPAPSPPSKRSDLDPVRKPVASPAVHEAVKESADHDDDPHERRRLSKAERKALRRQQRDQYEDD